VDSAWLRNLIAGQFMSEEDNVLLVRSAYRATAQGDTTALVNLLAADVVWRLPQMRGVPFAGEWRGREGVAKFFAAVAQSQEVVEFQPEQFIAQGKSVVVLGRFTMRVRATDRISRSQWAHIWTVESEQVSLFREYVDTAAVVAAHAQQ
jgi:ketosteroid isomerase-like protein